MFCLFWQEIERKGNPLDLRYTNEVSFMVSIHHREVATFLFKDGWTWVFFMLNSCFFKAYFFKSSQHFGFVIMILNSISLFFLAGHLEKKGCFLGSLSIIWFFGLIIRILSLSQMEILKYRIIFAAAGSIPNETDILTLSFVIINLVKNE